MPIFLWQPGRKHYRWHPKKRPITTDFWTIFGVYGCTPQDFETFVIQLNNLNTSITVKASIHPDSVDFLDTTTFKGPDFLEMGNTMAARFYHYKYNIVRKQNSQTSVIKHFIKHGWPSIKATVLEGNPYWSTEQCRRAERRWISLLDTV